MEDARTMDDDKWSGHCDVYKIDAFLFHSSQFKFQVQVQSSKAINKAIVLIAKRNTFTSQISNVTVSSARNLLQLPHVANHFPTAWS
jgi:hypothetical protein